MNNRAGRNKDGTGSIYRQRGRGPTWRMQWHDADGQRHNVSTGTTDEAEARAQLNKVLAAVADGERVDLGRKAFRFEDAVTLYNDDQFINGRTDRQRRANIVKRHLVPVFGRKTLDTITRADVMRYYAARLAAGAAKATINGELAALRRMFRLATQAGKFRGPLPLIPLPDPKNARTGFFERDQYEAVLRELPVYWHGLFTLAYFTGWRVASELCVLEWRHVDQARGLLRLEDSKNGEGRIFPYRLLPEVTAAITTAARERDQLAAKGTIVARVFHRKGKPLVRQPSGARRTGSMLRSLLSDWAAACRRAGVPGRMPHDCRRTAVRNLVRAGVSEHMAMQLTGHKTREVFARYDIINETDLTQAVARYAEAGR